jgi:hypothetical protein
MDIPTTTRTATLLLSLCLSLIASVQANEAPPSPNLRALPEEVMVTSDRSLYTLRSQMLDAEKRAYDVFNKFNDEKRFNISCSTSQPTGTRFKRQSCSPEFQIQATTIHARGYLDTLRDHLSLYSKDGDTIPNNIMDVGTRIASQHKDYQQKLRQVAMENPEFLNALIEYSQLRERYEAATRTARE